MTGQGKTGFAPGPGRLRRQLAAAVALSLTAGLAAAAAWPTVALPEGVASFPTGGEITVNGLPLRMHGIVSGMPPGQVAALFRARLGTPLVEHTRGATLVLGRALGEFYATVQLEPAGTGTRGLVAVTRPVAALAGRHDGDAPEPDILAGFPAGTRLLNRSSTSDGTRRAEFVALGNALGIDFNVRHLRRTLGAQGYTLERQSSAGSGERNSRLRRPPAGTTLLFRRPGAEAIAVLFRGNDGNTAIALNTVTTPEPAK